MGYSNPYEIPKVPPGYWTTENEGGCLPFREFRVWELYPILFLEPFHLMVHEFTLKSNELHKRVEMEKGSKTKDSRIIGV